MDEIIINCAHTISRIFIKKNWLNYFGTKEDIEQEAVLAALIALKKYDPNRSNANLKSFITTCIYNHLIRATSEGRLIRVPRSRAKSKAAEKAYRIEHNLEDIYRIPEQENNDINIFNELDQYLNQEEIEYVNARFRDSNTRQQIGKSKGITKEAVRKREQKILEKIKEKIHGNLR